MPIAKLRRSMTRLLALGHVIFFLSWVFPLHGTPLPGRVSIVHVVASNVPVWTVGFGVTAALLSVAAFRPTTPWMAHLGHASGAIVCLAFAGATGTSALIAEPPGSVISSVAFLLITAWHLLLQRYYKAGG